MCRGSCADSRRSGWLCCSSCRSLSAPGAQDVSPARVSGTVVDQQGMPVVGAGVVVRGTQTGSVTDLDGRFTVMAAKDATLTVSFIGYTTREVPVGTQTDIRIVLEENVQSIDDVVVSASAPRRRRPSPAPSGSCRARS